MVVRDRSGHEVDDAAGNGYGTLIPVAFGNAQGDDGIVDELQRRHDALRNSPTRERATGGELFPGRKELGGIRPQFVREHYHDRISVTISARHHGANTLFESGHALSSHLSAPRTLSARTAVTAGRRAGFSRRPLTLRAATGLASRAAAATAVPSCACRRGAPAWWWALRRDQRG